MWAGKGVLLWGGEQVDISAMFAGKGVLLWRGGQVDISAHVGWEGCPSLGR